MLSLIMVALLESTSGVADPPISGFDDLPIPGQVKVDAEKGEVILPAKVRHPTGKPCIDDWGERLQAFIGCDTQGGKPAEMVDYFVFLVRADLDDVYQGLVRSGAKTKFHCSVQEGKELAGREYLQGDPVLISVFWKEGDRWIERAHEDFVQEKTTLDGKTVVKPWTPHFVFHGSGVLHKGRMGCIATPSACPSGIIADNRYPIFTPKPVVKFDLKQTPPVGSDVYIRIRTIASSPAKPGKPISG